MLPPMKNAIAQSSAKLEVSIARAQPSAASEAMSALATNAGLRPMRCISSAAGSDIEATPSTDSDSGSVARAGLGAM